MTTELFDDTDAPPAAGMNGHAVTVTPKIWRETEDADAINAILNDPAVFPLISLPEQEAFDVMRAPNDGGLPPLADPRNVFLMTEGGCMLFVPDPEVTSGIYEVHINFLPGHRGRHALDAAVAACRWMFTHTNCMTIVTRVPAFNKPAAAAAKACGGSLWFERKAAWPSADGPVDVAFYTLTLQEWSRRYPDQLIEAGRAFHKRLEEEYERHGFMRAPHADDDAHDLAVGLACETIYGGEPEKAAIIYNRWARLAGYGQMNIVSRNQLVIDIGEALLHVAGRSFKVIQCRSAQP